MAKLEFFYDVVCPYAYLAHTQIEAICERHGAELSWQPILLGGLFREIDAGDGPMPGMPAVKAQLGLRDMMRWAEHWDVPLNMPPSHPNRTVLALRCILASDAGVTNAGVTNAGISNAGVTASKALFKAYWVDSRDVSQREVVVDVLTAAGLDGAALVEAASEQPIKDELRTRTARAASLGMFGVPTCVVTTGTGATTGTEATTGSEATTGTHMLWGQDRLHFVEQYLREGTAA